MLVVALYIYLEKRGAKFSCIPFMHEESHSSHTKGKLLKTVLAQVITTPRILAKDDIKSSVWLSISSVKRVTTEEYALFFSSNYALSLPGKRNPPIAERAAFVGKFLIMRPNSVCKRSVAPLLGYYVIKSELEELLPRILEALRSKAPALNFLLGVSIRSESRQDLISDLKTFALLT